MVATPLITLYAIIPGKQMGTIATGVIFHHVLIRSAFEAGRSCFKLTIGPDHSILSRYSWPGSAATLNA